MISEKDARELKFKRDVQENAEIVARLRAEIKTAAKESVDKQRCLQEEASVARSEVDATKTEIKKLKERLDASTSYIEAMKNKNPQQQQQLQQPIQLSGSVESSNVSELQGAVKSMQQQNALLHSVNETLKRRETDLTAQIVVLEKTVRENASFASEADIRAERARSEIKNLTLSVDQLKQVQRSLEQRAKGAETELEALKSSQSSVVEGAVASENVMAAECKKLRADLDKISNLHDSSLAKLSGELREAREERDAALDMLASQSLDAEGDLTRATTTLRQENENLKQSVRALEARLTQMSNNAKLLEESMTKQQLLQQQQNDSKQRSPLNKTGDVKSMAEAHEKLKQELREAQSKLHVEVESLTTLLEEEMLSHQSTQQQLRETKVKLDLQNQAAEVLRAKVDRLTGETNEMASMAKDSSSTDKALLQSLQNQLQTQTEACASLKDLVGSKDQKLASLKLCIEELELNDSKASQRHDDVRTRLDQALTQERENQRQIQTLTDAKKGLEERLAECRADQAAEQSGLSSKLAETTLRVQEVERALRENAALLEKETSLAGSLQKRVLVLEMELVAAREALSRTELSSSAALEDLKAQLAAQTAFLTRERDEAIAEATKKVNTLTADVESMRMQLKSASDSAKAARSELEDHSSSLFSQLNQVREVLRDREASIEAAELKRQQVESALLFCTRRAEEAEAQCRQERNALMLALQEADMSRSMAAEAEIAAEAAQTGVARAKVEARSELLLLVDSSKRDAEEWQMRAQDAETRAQSYMEQLAQSEREWARQRELLQSAVSNTDLKVNNAQRDAEARLLDSNLALFEARNKLMELEPRYQDAVVLAEKLEARALVWEEEKTKSEMNWQIRLDEMEDNLTEAKDEAEQAVRKVQAQAEKDLQVAVERAAKAESDAFEARRLATAGQSEISLVANQAQLELNEMLRRNELLGEEVTQKTIAMERATQEAARVMQQLDDVTSTLSLVRSQLQDSNRSLAEKNAALDSAKLEIERLSNTIATAESQRTECEIRARDALQTLQQSSAEQILMLDERLRGESEVIAALKTELMVTRKEAQTAQQLAQVLICLFCCLK
jgi:hypothetical protein